MSDQTTLPDEPAPISPDAELARRKLDFEYYKARLDYRKFVLGSVFVAIAIAAIPPGFQLAAALLEYVKSEQKLRIDTLNAEAERLLKQQTFRDTYIKEFLSNGLSQDVELRIRFADYFAHVAAEPYKSDWKAYHTDLVGHRDQLRGKIDTMESDWRNAAQAQNDVEISRLERNLQWAYKELGYLEHDRSVAINPRAPEQTSDQLPPRPAFGPATADEKARLWNCNYEWAPVAGSPIGLVKILGDWEQKNIASVPIPQLRKALGDTAPESIRFNVNAAEALKAAWAEVEEKNLLDRVVSFDGSFLPRLRRGLTATLDIHACGTAFDINAAYNPSGAAPRQIGQKGSVVELVPIFNKYGFYWGGHFPGRVDAMHFELAVQSNKN
jgi:hypothetical protein